MRVATEPLRRPLKDQSNHRRLGRVENPPLGSGIVIAPVKTGTSSVGQAFTILSDAFLPAHGAFGDQLTFAETDIPADVHQHLSFWSVVGWALHEVQGDTSFLELAHHVEQVQGVTRKTIRRVNDESLNEAAGSSGSDLGEDWAIHFGASPDLMPNEIRMDTVAVRFGFCRGAINLGLQRGAIRLWTGTDASENSSDGVFHDSSELGVGFASGSSEMGERQWRPRNARP